MRKFHIIAALLLLFGALHAQKNIYVVTTGNANALVQQLVTETTKDIIRQSEVFLPSEQSQGITLTTTVNKNGSSYEFTYKLTQPANEFEKTLKSNITDIDEMQSSMTKDVNTLLIALLKQNPGLAATADDVPQSTTDKAPTATRPNTTVTGTTPNLTYREFKAKIRKEKGAFMDMESMAFKKYQVYKGLHIAGWSCFGAGLALAVPVGIPVFLLHSYFNYAERQWIWDPVPGIVCMSVGGGIAVAGIAMLCCKNTQLQRSYQYYIQGDKRELTMDFHPVFGSHSSVGLGLTMRF